MTGRRLPDVAVDVALVGTVVLLISITLRATFAFYDLVTPRHLDILAKLNIEAGFGNEMTTWSAGLMFGL